MVKPKIPQTSAKVPTLSHESPQDAPEELVATPMMDCRNTTVSRLDNHNGGRVCAASTKCSALDQRSSSRRVRFGGVRESTDHVPRQSEAALRRQLAGACTWPTRLVEVVFGTICRLHLLASTTWRTRHAAAWGVTGVANSCAEILLQREPTLRNE